MAITPDNERIKQAITKAQNQVKQALAKAQNQARRDKVAAYFSGLWSDRWYSVGAYWDVYLIEPEDGSKSADDTINLLHGGKFGMKLGLRHLVMGAHFALAGYQTSYAKYAIDGFGLGGDFSIGYSLFSPEAGSFSSDFSMDGLIIANITIGPGITVLHYFKNPFNAPTIFPYVQLNLFFFCGELGVKLELPVIDGKVTPKFGLDIGLALALSAK
ncbi:MAG: hypothetical protein LBT01_01080 [Spirochaetaceae bacterium]|nr:hypothetical protein [Spirochaetaceae bacterium]